MQKKYTVIQPQYVDKFQCDGAACQSLCCQKWRIDIDDHTLKKYKKLTDKALKTKILSAIKRNRTKNVHVFKLSKDNRKCLLLCDDNLCFIHRNLGEEYLSDVCATYPRLLKEINGYLTQTLDLTCPLAAKLALLNPEPMCFEQVNKTCTRPIQRKIDLQKSAFLKPVFNYFIDMQMFFITILQNRKFTIEERLIIIGLFLDKADEMQAKKEIHKMPALIDYYDKIINSDEIFILLNSFQANIDEKIKQSLYWVDHVCKDSLSESLVKYTDMLITALHLQSENDIHTLRKTYLENNELYYVSFTEKYSYIIENYLVSLVFQNTFPFLTIDTLSRNYILFIVFYSLSKFLFIGVVSERKENTCPDDYIEFITVFLRLASTSTYFDELNNNLINQDKDIFYYISTFLK